MSRLMGFASELDVELVDGEAAQGRGTWRLLSKLLYGSRIVNPVICIPKGFITDFASVPRLPFVFLMVGDSGSEAAALHDYLYSIAKYSRKICDSIFKEACLITDVPKWRTYLLYAGVRLFGATHYGTTK